MPSDLIPPAQREQIFKQRRSLFAFTFILVAIHGAAVSLGESVQLQGLLLDIDRPTVIILGLWAAWLYSAYRYWLYWRALPWGEVEAQLSRLTTGNAERILQNRAVQTIANIPNLQLSDKQHVQLTARRGEAQVNRKADGSGGTLSAMVQSLDASSGRPIGPAFEVNLDLTAAELAQAERQARRYFSATHHHWTDYTAPFYIAALAPLALLVGLFLQTSSPPTCHLWQCWL